MSTSPISDKILIDKFLDQKLSKEEKIYFIERKKEEAFNLKLEEAVMKQLGRQKLKEKLKSLKVTSKDVTTPVRSIKKYYKILVATAAITILLFGLSIFIKSDNTTLQTDKLFADHYKPYPNIYNTKGAGDQNKTMLDKALQLYDNENYDEAVSAFAKAISKTTANSNVLFYYGQSLLANGDMITAKQQFYLIEKQDPLYNEAQWYLGLILVKQDSISNAKTVLNIGSQNASKSQKEKIGTLLNQLKD